ncbi:MULTISPECIES: dienelactone hydrolase family protein [Marinomonas]|uniref:dienelactone hydrolase family protein n=1 Tax=Marinomonas TaxID=28253 RepID=UPI001054BF4B|nr:dienelactone hydrolase family protein [Marinomonas flavescens]
MSDNFQSLFIDNVNRKHYQVDSSVADSKPIHVVIWPTFSGLSEFEKSIADKVASFGYSATAVDLYGSDRILESVEEKLSLMGVLLENAESLHGLQRSLTEQSTANISDKTVVHIGFCLGGRLALEAGLHFKNTVGAVSFHGLMSFNRAAENQVNRDLKIMVLNGYDDRSVTDENALAAKQYWAGLGIDFQFIDFGNTMHSFMLPSANNPEHGSMYNPIVAERGYRYLQGFLNEL